MLLGFPEKELYLPKPMFENWCWMAYHCHLSALDIMESRLGFGWKSPRRFWLCDAGRIRDARERLTKSPSTVPILTIEFAIADLRAYNLCDTVLLLWLTFLIVLTFLCKLHRNDPGCVVGEHMHFFFCPLLHALLLFLWLLLWFLSPGDAMEWPGELPLRWSIEKQTDGDGET